MNFELLFITPIILIGLSTFLIVRMTFQDQDEFKAKEQVEELDRGSIDFSDYGIILKYSRPFFRRYITPVVSNMKSKKKIKQKYEKKLANAGLKEILTIEDFFSFKIFLIIGFPILFLGIRAFLEETWSLSYIPLIAVLGFFYPDIWVNGRIDQRKKEIIINMPFAVDMLALSVEAGLDFIAAIAKVVDKSKKILLQMNFQHYLKR